MFMNEVFVSLPLESVPRNLVLEIHITDGRSVIMRVEALQSRDMLQADPRALDDLLKRQVVPRIRGGTIGFRSINDPPVVVLVPVRIEGDLLFLWSACETL